MRQSLERDFQERIDDLVKQQQQYQEENKYTYADPDWEAWEDSLSHYDDYSDFSDYCDDMYDDMLDRDRDEYFNDYDLLDDHISWYDDDYDYDVRYNYNRLNRFHPGRYYKNEQNGDIYLCCQLISGEKHLICTKTGQELRDLCVISQLS